MANAAPAALGAKRLLSSAARTLRTADPVEQLGPFIDESLNLPAGSYAYRAPHAFETQFSEQRPRNLDLGLRPGDPSAPSSDRVQATTRAMRHLVGGNFGNEALRWLDGRTEALSYGSGEAWVSSSFDGEGIREAHAAYSWGPHTAESLPVTVHEAVQNALEAMPSLRPAFTSVKCGRSYGSQEITFSSEGPVQLSDLKPLMDRFGLGGQHTRLTNALAFVLGARFTLPPNSTLVTLRPTPAGIELRVDVNLEAVPDVPSNVASLLQLQLAERPHSLAALERWVMAMTPENHISPGSMSVLSVIVRPQLGPRIAMDLRPSVVASGDDQAPPGGSDTVARGGNRDGNGEALVGASAARSPWEPRS